MYDFTTVVNRRGTGASKWEFAPAPVAGSGQIPLSVADMEFRVAPEIQQAVIQAAEHGIYGYTCPDEAYFNALRDYLIRHHGYEVKREWHTVTNGVVTAISVAVRAFTKPGEGVIVQTPVYYPFFQDITNNGRAIVENRLLLKDGRYEMDFDGLERLCAKEENTMLILSSPHNPVGRVWSMAELERLNDICKRNGVFVVSDEIHCDLLLNGAKHHSFLTVPGGAENCMVCTAMSKTCNLAGLACSDIFIPDEARRKAYFEDQERSTGSGLPYFARAAGIAAHTRCDGWIEEMLRVIERNFELLYRFVETRLPMLTCIRAEGTYLAWIDMRLLGLSDEELEKMHLNAYLALDEGYIFGANGSGFARWNLALPEKELTRALDRLELAIKETLAKRGR